MKTPKFAAVAFAVVTALSQAQADQTNLVQTLHVGLSAMKQGRTTTNRNTVVTSIDADRLDTRQIIGAIGSVTGNTFSRASKLVLVTPVDGGVSQVEIRDGDVKLDVSGFFVFEQIGGSVSRGVQFLKTGDTVQTTYSIQRLALQDLGGYPSLPVHFDVRGLAVDLQNSRDESGQFFDLNAEVTGSGDSNGSETVIRGVISISGGTVEIVPDGGGVPT